MKIKSPAEPVEPGRDTGYCRGSTSKQILTADAQKTAIKEYIARLGRTIPDSHFYVDDATTSDIHVKKRPAGKRMLAELRPGDTLVVAKLDRLSRSYLEFAEVLDILEKRRVTLHVADIPAGVFDPTNPISMLLIQILIAFAGHEKAMIRARTREALQSKKAKGERHCRHAEWGWEWVKRWNPKLQKHDFVKLSNELEQAIVWKVVELKEAGYSHDYIRQYLNYEWRVFPRPRDGKTAHHWQHGGICNLLRLGAKWRADGRNPVGPKEDNPC